MSVPPVPATDNPAVFAIEDEAAGRGIILNPVGSTTTEERWATEIPGPTTVLRWPPSGSLLLR